MGPAREMWTLSSGEAMGFRGFSMIFLHSGRKLESATVYRCGRNEGQ